jgi:hypothetical protein
VVPQVPKASIASFSASRFLLKGMIWTVGEHDLDMQCGAGPRCRIAVLFRAAALHHALGLGGDIGWRVVVGVTRQLRRTLPSSLMQLEG